VKGAQRYKECYKTTFETYKNVIEYIINSLTLTTHPIEKRHQKIANDNTPENILSSTICKLCWQNLKIRYWSYLSF